MSPQAPPFQWIAGVIDARAHIVSTNRHGHSQPRIRVTTRKIELLEALARFTGTKVVIDNAGYERRPCGAHCTQPHSHIVRQSAQWTADSSRATIMLYTVLPYMYAQREEATLCLEAGLKRFPPAKGDVHKQMAQLGWPLPPVPSQLRAVS